MSLSEETRAQIEQILGRHKVVLFMKGNRHQPMCGFSARAVGLLEDAGVAYETVDVLREADIRQGIKDFSQWPTIPQLYIDREFIGGSDIMQEMAGSGELHAALGVTYTPPTAPTIHVTDAMAAVLREHGRSNPGSPRLEISPRFEYGIGFGPRQEGDFAVESNGITLLVDRGSARRADGMTLDYAAGPNGGVVIDNPNEPPGVTPLDVFQLQERLAAGTVTLFDVRTLQEREIAQIAGAIHLDEAGMARLQGLPHDAPIAFHCHHGMRSQQAAQHFLQQGFRKVYNVSGGIDAWSLNIDTTVPRY